MKNVVVGFYLYGVAAEIEQGGNFGIARTVLGIEKSENDVVAKGVVSGAAGICRLAREVEHGSGVAHDGIVCKSHGAIGPNVEREDVSRSTAKIAKVCPAHAAISRVRG